MTTVDETDLPGVGTRFAFGTSDRRRLGVIRHHDGRRELFIADADDPDCVDTAISLLEGEAHLLADLLGGSEVTRDAIAVAQGVAGLTVDWIDVKGDSAVPGSSIGDLQIRSRTGASVVAVLRGEHHHPAPEPGFVFSGGDVAVVVGTAEGVRAVRGLLQGEEAAS